MIRCPQCGCEYSVVVDTRKAKKYDALYRRRECEKCAGRFTTYEVCSEDFKRTLATVRMRAMLQVMKEALDEYGRARRPGR